MIIHKLYPRGFGANCYVISADGKNAIVIDPAQEDALERIQALGLEAKFVLLTHCHFDHVGGVARLQKAGAKVFCSKEEKTLVNTSADLFELFGAPRARFSYQIDGELLDNEVRDFCGVQVKTLLTNGHTAGNCTFEICEKEGGRYLFTGDTLFEGSIGRTDFPTGSTAQMQQSLKRLCALSGDYIIHSGHGEQTTLNQEKKSNPFLCDC